MEKQKGQIILVLILVMTVALAIGLSVIQKSLTDVSTSTKVEQSSRAFSAAEAGIERVLKRPGITDIAFPENDSAAKIADTGLIPCIPGSTGCAQGANTQQAPLEYPPLSKEEITQVWLTDYTSTDNPPTCTGGKACYKQSTLDVYWGNSSEDKAALELTLIYYDGSKYASRKWYLDHQNAQRDIPNNFAQVFCGGGGDERLGGTQYQCKERIGDSNPPADTALPQGLMLIRARLLYNSSSQPFAVQPPPSAVCGADCSLPAQARVLLSTGVSGETQRQVSVFQLNNVVPHWFDYAIFSSGEISK